MMTTNFRGRFVFFSLKRYIWINKINDIANIIQICTFRKIVSIQIVNPSCTHTFSYLSIKLSEFYAYKDINISRLIRSSNFLKNFKDF